MRPHWVPNDHEEALILKSIRETLHPLTIPGTEATVQHNAVYQREPDQLPGRIPQPPEVKLGMQREPDKKGRPRAWDENLLSATYHWI